MKNNVHKCFCFMFFFSSAILFSQENSFYDFSLETNLLLQTGVVDELVFENNLPLSKLKWRQYVTPLVNITYNARLSSVFLKSQVTSAIPIKSGILEDFDYLSFSDTVTHYSKHDLYVDKSFSFDVQVSYRFKLTQKINIHPLVGFTYQNRKFTARDGYLQYPNVGEPWSDTLPITPLSGSSISYEQTILSPYVGVENILIFNDLMVNAGLSFFPFVYVDALDNHYLRQVQFYDEMRGGYIFSLTTSLVMPISDTNYGLKFGLDYEYFRSTGKTGMNDLGVKQNDFILSQNSTAGTISNLFRVSVGFVLNPNFWK